MDDERDLVVFEDDAGNEITMEVLDYFFYEGNEYALLTEASEACEGCEDGECEGCEDGECEGCESLGETYVMQIVPVGEDEEEFVPVDDELADKLKELIESGLYDDGETLDDEDSDDPE